MSLKQDEEEEGGQIDTSSKNVFQNEETVIPQVDEIQDNKINHKQVMAAATQLLTKLRERRTMHEKMHYDVLQKKGTELLKARVAERQQQQSQEQQMKMKNDNEENKRVEKVREEEKEKDKEKKEQPSEVVPPATISILGKRRRMDGEDSQTDPPRQQIPPAKRQFVPSQQQVRQNAVSRSFSNRFSIGDSLQKRGSMGSRFQ